MEYGHFDDAAREYVIERPDTPMSWVNYLGTDEYCAIISNNASGYAFSGSPRTGRHLRFRFNSVPMDRPGRYVYLRDQSDGDFWSLTWQPVGKSLQEFKATAAHGPGYTRFQSEYRGIKARARVFVPPEEPLEIWEVELENHGPEPKALDVFGYAEWCFWQIDQDAFNFQYILYTCRMGYADGIVDYSIVLWPFNEPKGFFACTLPVKSFDTDRDAFIGPYRHEGTASAVEVGVCGNTLALGGTPCGALHSQLTLAPGEKKRFVYLVGVGDARELGKAAQEKYRDPQTTQEAFDQVQKYWQERLSAFSARTPDPATNSMINVWNQLQCHTTFNWSRSASFNEAGGRDGLGFRDSNQDTLAVVHVLPEAVRKRIVELLEAQHSFGAAMHSVQPRGFRQGAHNLAASYFSDDHLWLIVAVVGYLKETADFALLDEGVPFADEGSASVFEHLVKAIDYSWEQRGPHGLCLGLNADWNDCLNLKGQGETAFSSFLLLRALIDLRVLAERKKDTLASTTLEQRERELRAQVDEHLWDGEWFLRGFLDSGRTIGGKASDQSQIFLNAQTWAVLSEAGGRDKLISAMDSVHRLLATEHGAVLNYPAYTEHDAEVGAITCFPKGLKENAGIFCHANTWAVIAEAMLGRGDHAYRLYKAFQPAAKNASAEKYTMEPYVYSQFITGKEHPHHFGRARNSWLTGTATWSFVAVTQYILGVRADYDGLVIDPAIPPEWPEVSVERVFRGASYQILIKNPDGVCGNVRTLTVDGVRREGNRVPVAASGTKVNVEVTLGA